MPSDWIGSAIQAGASLVGGLFDLFGSRKANEDSAEAQRRQFEYDKQLLENNQQWMAEMSNTAHQREVQDLRQAGINPIYTATGGSGASVGSPGTPSVGQGQTFKSDMMQTATNILTAIQQARNNTAQTNSNITLQNAQTQRTILGLEKDRSEIQLNLARTDLTKAERDVAEKRLAEIDANIQYLQDSIRISQQNANSLSVQANSAYQDSLTRRYELPIKQQNADANTLNAETNASWQPARVVGAIGNGLLGIGLGLLPFGGVAKAGKLIKTVSTHKKYSKLLNYR